jgi:Tfp pilus assembly protein PilV
MGMVKTKLRGFSVAELLLSLGFIAVAILTVLGLTATSLQAGREATDATTAALVAQTQLEKAIRTGKDDMVFWNVDHTAVPYAPGSGLVSVDGTTFEYEVFAETVKDTGGSDVGTTVEAQNRLKKVDIVVHWWDSDSQERQGYGKLEVRQTRLVAEGSHD